MREGIMAEGWPSPLHNWLYMSGGKGRARRPDPEEMERFIAMRLHRGGGFGGPPFGGGRGRRRRGDVRAALLRLISEEPRNGYQLMQAIEELSGGRWRPSPGSVYPSLSQLEDEGLIRSTEVDGGKVFEITDAGRENLAEHGDGTAPWEFDDGDAITARELKSMIAPIAAAAWQVAQAGDEQQVAKARELLADTRRGLYRILADERAQEA
jgi:DNA-binding PadR family transcriptional regulator